MTLYAKLDVFINLFLLFYLHILLGKCFLWMLSSRTKTYVAFTEVHQFICICFSGSVRAGPGEALGANLQKDHTWRVVWELAAAFSSHVCYFCTTLADVTPATTLTAPPAVHDWFLLNLWEASVTSSASVPNVKVDRSILTCRNLTILIRTVVTLSWCDWIYCLLQKAVLFPAAYLTSFR